MIHSNGIRVPVDDDGASESIEFMSQALPAVIAVIREQIANGHSVLVHCMAGQQRSACVVAGYLIKYHKMSVDEAIEFVRSKKSDAFFWRVHFEESLWSLFVRLNL
mgnify:CR=1 FL=1